MLMDTLGAIATVLLFLGIRSPGLRSLGADLGRSGVGAR
jgi:hypothetical protein